MPIKQHKDKPVVVIIGLGYVGLPLALLVAKKNYQVIGIDIDAEKIAKLKKQQTIIKDRQIIQDLKTTPLEVTTDFTPISKASIIIICVPTPIYDNNLPNLEPIKSACHNLAPFLHKNQLVILESTVNPGVCENIILPILEQQSSLIGGKDFYLAHCPERINPGDSKWNVSNINRVVGGLEIKSLTKAIKFYQSILSAKIKAIGSLKETEAVKIVENSFRDINIAFVNELAMSFSQLGIDLVNVINGCTTKPFSFLPHYPGCGVGGHCIPVDPYYLIEYAKKNNFFHNFLILARQINNQMPQFTAELTIKGLKEAGIPIKNTKVAVLGLAYKPEIADCRESPAWGIIKNLTNNNITVMTYDPFVPDHSSALSLDEAVKDAQAVVIATAHKAFTKLSPKFFLKHQVKVVIDGRNCLTKKQFIDTGIIYKGIGR